MGGIVGTGPASLRLRRDKSGAEWVCVRSAWSGGIRPGGAADLASPGRPGGWWTRMSTLLILGIQGAADAEAGFVEDVGVDLGGGDVGVTQQLLNGPQVVVVFE